MKVTFTESAMADPTVWSTLDRIIDFFWQGRHMWVIDDLDKAVQSNWIQSDVDGRAGRRNRETIEKFATRMAYPVVASHAHALAIVVTTTPSTDSELTPDDARNCLESPAYVLVENSTSDGAFLRAMITVMNREDLFVAMSRNWCRIEHLGGFGEVAKRVEEIRGRHPGPLRAFVLTDSDCLYPGHITPVIRQVTSYCRSNSIPYAILKKRKIENYLPDLVLTAVNRRTYLAYAQLTSEQRDHYDLKRGFIRNSRDRAVVPPEQTSLYAHVRAPVLRDLCGGFGPDVWRCFQTDFHRVSAQEIRALCSNDPTEIDRILDELESLL